ncbi:hypothetical protein [Bacillus sp. AFS017336]|uniref:hypothetical protein n=1 Tax=Bacillus sp. AFS017336 TaxID=2033489 RepID=UPI000BEF9AD4|nr:hypothetical protein [Bacillus sp. AFS017336]PEL04222.1 hypothetical protein CN601_21745 [Bacillus sp. AFS017336]
MSKKIISVLVLILIFVFVSHYYYVHSSTKRVFEAQTQLKPINYIDTIYKNNDAYILAMKDKRNVYALYLHKNIFGWRAIHGVGAEMKLNSEGGLVVGNKEQISFGIIDQSVKEVRLERKKLPLIKYSELRIWYNIAKPNQNQLIQTRPLIIYK